MLRFYESHLLVHPSPYYCFLLYLTDLDELTDFFRSFTRDTVVGNVQDDN